MLKISFCTISPKGTVLRRHISGFFFGGGVGGGGGGTGGMGG